jgi:hypothetical protein
MSRTLPALHISAVLGKRNDTFKVSFHFLAIYHLSSTLRSLSQAVKHNWQAGRKQESAKITLLSCLTPERSAATAATAPKASPPSSASKAAPPSEAALRRKAALRREGRWRPGELRRRRPVGLPIGDLALVSKVPGLGVPS